MERGGGLSFLLLVRIEFRAEVEGAEGVVFLALLATGGSLATSEELEELVSRESLGGDIPSSSSSC